MLHQDDEACVLLANNGGMLCQKGTKHVQARCFFAADWIEQKEIKVKHMPTESMVGDCCTKPVQGAPFRKFRDLILGIDGTDAEEHKRTHREALEKCGLAEQAG